MCGDLGTIDALHVQSRCVAGRDPNTITCTRAELEAALRDCWDAAELYSEYCVRSNGDGPSMREQPDEDTYITAALARLTEEPQ